MYEVWGSAKDHLHTGTQCEDMNGGTRIGRGDREAIQFPLSSMRIPELGEVTLGLELGVAQEGHLALPHDKDH